MIFGFFRKHQKWIFGTVATVVVLSFSFAGTYSALMGPGQGEGSVARTLPDGTRVSAREWQQLVVFLKSSRAVARLARDPLQVNLLNDGVIEQDLLGTGVAAQLAMALGEVGAQELAAREAKERLTPLYVHPKAAMVSQQKLWEQLAPQMAMAWNQWAASQGAPLEERWQQRVDLFLTQQSVPPQWSRTLLQHLERAQKGLEPDPRLAQGDLALFGYHNLEDWFGRPFVEAAASWILHGAMYAEQLGHQVGLEEARLSLRAQGQEAFNLLQKDPRLEGMPFEQFYGHLVGQWAGDEELATRLWQRVLLVRKLLSTEASVALGAALPYERFGQYATRSWKIKRYELPGEWRASSDAERGLVKAYLDVIHPSKSVPEVAEGLRKWPALMACRYQVELASTSQQELEAQIPLQLVRSWEAENLSRLRQKFSFMAGQKSLDQVSAADRRQLDQYARQQLVEAHPEWVGERLAKATVKKQELLVSFADVPSQLPGISSKELMDYLDSRADQPITAGGHTYLIHVLNRGEPQFLTFSEARQLGVIKGTDVAIHPLESWLREAHEALTHGVQEAEWVATGHTNPLGDQFKLLVREETVDRNSPWAQLQVGAWSDLDRTGLDFCQCTAIEPGCAIDRTAAEQKLIEQVARHEMAVQLTSAASSGAATL